MTTKTDILHVKVSTQDADPVVTPLYQCSAFHAASPYFYTRKANPNSVELERVVATLEGAKHCLSVTTGMSAASLALSLARPGSDVVLNTYTYGCSFKLFQRLAPRLSCRLRIIDLTREAEIARIPATTSLVFMETPTNPFLKTVSISAVARQLEEVNPDAVLIVDNTWATPLWQKPLRHGADVSVYSATKFFSGHSDVMGGFLTTDNDDLFEMLSQERFYTGVVLDPHSAWLLRRSMQTFMIRMEEHERVTLEMKAFLEGLPQVGCVYYPEVSNGQLDGYGGILFLTLNPRYAAQYERFAGALELFETGTAMACVTSMVAQPYSGSHGSLTDDEKQLMEIDPGLVRLCFGLEDVDDLKADLRRAFSALCSTAG